MNNCTIIHLYNSELYNFVTIVTEVLQVIVQFCYFEVRNQSNPLIRPVSDSRFIVFVYIDVSFLEVL